MQDLDLALAEHAPPNSDVSLTFELPQLALDGIPTPVDKMNQVSQLFTISDGDRMRSYIIFEIYDNKMLNCKIFIKGRKPIEHSLKYLK